MLKNTLKVLKKIGGKLGLLKITWALGVWGGVARERNRLW